MIVVITTLIAFSVIYKFLTKDNEIFKNRGVAFEKPTFFFGNMFVDLLMGNEEEPTIFKHLYERFSREKIFGVFMLFRPIFVVKDNNLIKQISEAHVDAFQPYPHCSSNSTFDESISDTSSDLNFINKRRNVLHQNFLFDADNLFTSGEDDTKEKRLIDVDELVENFVSESIAEIFIGNVEKAQEISNIYKSTNHNLFKAKESLRFLANGLMPKLTKLQKESKLNPFITDTFSATTRTLRNCLEMLTKFPEIQQEIIQEIKEKNIKSKSIFENLNSIAILEATVLETLRLKPVISLGTIICTKDCTIKTEDNEHFKFKKDDFIQFPFKVIQNDSKNFQNPDQFNPNRFIKDPSKKLFLERKCLFENFVQQQTKLFLFQILIKYRIENCSTNLKENVFKFIRNKV